MPENWQWGFVRLDAAFLLAGGAFVTSWLARKLQHKLPIAWRLGLLTTLLFLLFLKMIWEMTA